MKEMLKQGNDPWSVMAFQGHFFAIAYGRNGHIGAVFRAAAGNWMSDGVKKARQE